MSYTAYERNTNTVIELVAEHCKHLTTNGIFNTSSIPKLASVEAWIDQAHFDIQTHLAKAGYDTVVADADTAVLGYLENLNVYGAVVQVELSRPVSGRDGEGNERWQEYKKLYEEGLTMLASDALEAMGHTRSDAVSAFVSLGGTSRSRKDVAYDDTDLVQPRFPRHFGRNPLNPVANSDSGTP